ncbi:hypothetical protein [Anoxybacteroides tepidamans]|uniref:hypothetical protein n=1 Tax=Anoxybacteroides tepidamans TaxID=265948 RepID=UPI0004884887|nr:hypothetical protein [Anoxybacillus tepidamans]
MSRYISIFFLVLGISFVLLLLLGNFVFVGGDDATLFALASIIIILLAFLIAQMFYLLDMLKKKR